MFSVVVILSLSVSLVPVSQVSAIHCFQCNSRNNSACMGLEVFLKRKDKNDILNKFGLSMVNCDSAMPMLPQKTKPKFFCRKMVQTILHPGYDSEIRITRGCGWIPHKRPCYTADNDDHLETVCQCYEDGCNGALIMKSSALWLISAISLLASLWKIRF